VSILDLRGADAMVVAGGTDLFPNMKRRQFEPKYLVGLSVLRELRGVRSESGSTIIGAGTTLTQITNYPLLQQDFPALTKSAGLVSTPQLRNSGTIGGNLCLDTRCNYYNQTFHWRKAIDFCMKKDGETCWVAPGGKRCWAISSTDCAPVAIALDARVRLVGPKGVRDISASQLYRDDGIRYVTKQPDEILTEIHLPPADGMKTAYLKLRRRGSFDFPVLGVAVALKQAEDKTITDCKIVLGGIASYPVEFEQAEKMLIGQKPTLELIEHVAQTVFGPARPMDNTDYQIYYRKRMAPVYVKRALLELTS